MAGSAHNLGLVSAELALHAPSFVHVPMPASTGMAVCCLFPQPHAVSVHTVSTSCLEGNTAPRAVRTQLPRLKRVFKANV